MDLEPDPRRGCVSLNTHDHVVGHFFPTIFISSSILTNYSKHACLALLLATLYYEKSNVIKGFFF